MSKKLPKRLMNPRQMQTLLECLPKPSRKERRQSLPDEYLPDEFGFCLDPLSDRAREALARIDFTHQRCMRVSWQTPTGSFMARIKIPKANTPRLWPGEYFRDPGPDTNPAKWYLQVQFLQVIRTLGANGTIPDPLADLFFRFQNVVSKRKLDRIIASRRDDSGRLVLSALLPAGKRSLMAWAHRFHLGFDWVLRAAHRSLDSWAWMLTNSKQIQQPDWYYPYIEVYRGPNSHIQPGDRKRLMFGDAWHWDPVTERRDIAEQRLLAQFETEMQLLLDQVEVECQSAGMVRGSQKELRRRSKATLEQYFERLARFQVGQESLNKVAPVRHRGAESSLPDRRTAKRELRRLAQDLDLVPIPRLGLDN